VIRDVQGHVSLSWAMEPVSGQRLNRGLGDVPEGERPPKATLWGTPRLGCAAVRLADGTRIAWWRGRWAVSPARGSSSKREVSFREIG
jgi:hypothetical protein